MSIKKNSTPDILSNIKLTKTVLNHNNSFDIPKENAVPLEYSRNNRSSFLTNSSSINNDGSKCPLKNSQTQRNSLSQPPRKVDSKPKKKRVRFLQLEIVDIESYKQYNKPMIANKKFNGCSCFVY